MKKTIKKEKAAIFVLEVCLRLNILLKIEQTTDNSSEQCTKVDVTGLRYDAFHSIRKKHNDEYSVKNIAFLFSLIIVHRTYVLVWNSLLNKQSTSIKLPNENERRTIR